MINIAILEDDVNYSEIISYKIEKCIAENFNLEFEMRSFNDVAEFSRFMEANKIDIAFIDIMVNGTNTMDWSVLNIRSRHTQVIFMTAYPQEAYSISETQCCYYLIKSRITDSTLSKAIQRALQKITKKDPNFINLKLGSKSISVNIHDILYIETFNNSIMLHMDSSEKISVYTSLKDFSKNLPPNFLRCHKSYMINMNHIRSYEPHKFVLRSGDSIPIPPKKYKGVVAAYENYLTNL